MNRITMNVTIQNATLISQLRDKLKLHHSLYRTPIKDVYLEDIWDQCINPNGSNWKPCGHQSGADTKLENQEVSESYQNKSGQLLKNKTQVKISSHRTSKYKTLEDKVNFISEKHCDKYVLLSRDEKEWEKGRRIYYLMIFDSALFDFKSLTWTAKTITRGQNKGQENGSFVGTKENGRFSAEIQSASTSNQLWVTADIDYLGGYASINMDEEPSTETVEVVLEDKTQTEVPAVVTETDKTTVTETIREE